MSVISIIKLSELQRFKRLDAEYYQPEYLRYYEKLKKIGSIRLGNKEYSKVTDGIHTSIDFDSESKIRCLSAQSVKKGYFDLSANTFISREQNDRNLKTSLHVGDVIISSVGTIGNCAVVPSDILPSNADRHVGIIRTTEKLNPFYLCAFLLSKYGRFQTERESTGNVQKNLFIDKITELLIPILPEQDEIATKLKEATELLNASEIAFQKAQNKLMSLLDLPETTFKEHNALTYVVSSQKIKQINRIDAEYYQPFYDYIENHLISKFDAKPIGKMDFIKVTTGQYSENYAKKSDETAPYIRGTDIANGTIDLDDIYYIEKKDQTESKKVKEGDVVATRVGTIGLSARIPKECHGATASDNLIRLRFSQKDLNSYYLSLYLNSPIGVSLMVRNSRGSVQQRLNQETLKDVIIPRMTLDSQESLASYVRESYESHKIAKQILKETINHIDFLIDDFIS